MVDRQFADAELAAWYDVLNPARDDRDFYLPLVMAAESVLDVGCGTGALLHAARDAGHTGRLCGLDPAVGMLAQARRRSDIEWVLGDLSSVAWEREFDLVVMTGHAFQVFVTDEELRAALAAIWSALTENGRFVFETRNPAARAWRRWTPEHVVEVTNADGVALRMWHQVRTPVVGDVVRFTTTFSSPGWERPRTSRSTLRFLGPDALSALLAEAGLVVEQQFGDWTGGPLTATSPEIISITRRGAGAQSSSRSKPR
ncbi:class I SAM-dependent DNA methyltransferase [Gandjariella thermophila]|uniref:Methyltransferase n=1 Tax=Gandjariella thermophila TaxID=1931992 RepID=A0A4D4J8R5_9PSEU|nr:class I SAM-dependent methyltransferase [Gandjariella thermophila]GDY31058.1 methyltransferase [Gandjariella thermophila]